MSGTMVPGRAADDEARSGADKSAAAEPPPASVSVGQQLQAARLAKGLSASDVAKALKLSLRQVDALEADDWQSLPCNTIIRGFVRNYARLLGLDSDQLMAELDRLTLPPAAELEMSVGTPVSMPQEGRVDRRDFIRVASGLIVLLLAVAAYFFMPQELWLSTVSALKSATQSAAVKPVAGVAQQDEAPLADPAADSAAAPTTSGTDTQPVDPAAATPAPASGAGSAPAAVVGNPLAVPVAAPPVAAATPAPVTAPASGAAVLSFSFEQPSWVEVRDASGKVVFSRKNDAGTQQEVGGQPPFAVVIGNAGHVTLRYKGKDVDLSSRSKGDVARLTVE